MFSVSIFTGTIALFCSATAVLAQVTDLNNNATVVSGNPVAAVFSAVLPNSVNTNLRGSVVAKADPSGSGVNFLVSLSGLPSEGGPFLYHIHENTISSDGNCTSAGAHLDPFGRGESPTCDADLPMTCQVGDLSGKHGSINGTEFSANYNDDYVSMIVGTEAYMGNRSLVVHFANKTRISCSNFTILDSGARSSASSSSTVSGSPTGTANLTASSATSASSAATTSSGSASGTTSSTSSSTASASASASTGGAGTLMLNTGALALGVLAMLI